MNNFKQLFLIELNKDKKIKIEIKTLFDYGHIFRTIAKGLIVSRTFASSTFSR
jgi:hypothetical protein